MNVELHDEVEHLLAEWETLLACDIEATSFVAPSWMTAWWEHWGDGARPWVLGVRERGRLIGLARYGFMRGGEPYKYWYGAEDLNSPNLIFYTGRPHGLRLRAGSGVEARAE